MDQLLDASEFEEVLAAYPRARVVTGIRIAVDRVRTAIGAGALEDDPAEPSLYVRLTREALAEADVPSLRRVINATGVVLHTNLGRAPLAAEARHAMAEAAQGYSNLEFDLGAGTRGSRYDHCVGLLKELTGADDALVVNNNAAALMLALNTVARRRGVAVSRGELVEIGGGFRVPEILERSEAVLVEVGSTNRTRAADYEKALATLDVGALLKVHRSNFSMTGFTEETPVAELARIAHAAGVPLVYDLGSGLVVEPALLGLPDEPRAESALRAGADVVAISGDKLLGGPQAGILLGSRESIKAMRANPMCRALRVDKVTLAGLEATLRLYRDTEGALRGIPALRALSRTPEELEGRVRECAAALAAAGVKVDVVAAEGAVGGGTCPGVVLPSWALAVAGEGTAERLAGALRRGTPPVVGRIVDDRVHLDLRTVEPDEEEDLVRRIAESVTGSS